MRKTKTIVTLLTGVLLVITTISGGCAKQAPPPPAPVMTALINIINDPQVAQGQGALYGGEFRPRNIDVSVGATVTWNNTDTARPVHMVVSNDGLFNKTLNFGESFSYTFTRTGTFAFSDPNYDNVDGTVTVQ